MISTADDAPAYRAQILDENNAADSEVLERLRVHDQVTCIDTVEKQRSGLARILPRVDDDIIDEPIRFAFYPWRSALVTILGPRAFRRLRLDRNRNKITRDEQDRLQRLSIGIVGLSVGHAIAHTLALEGAFGVLKLADFDEIELSNLNRIPGTIFDLGVNKAVVAARRISELDPYLDVEVYRVGISNSTMESFFENLDLVIDECDSLDMKFAVRQEARARRIPLLMETSDRGLLDVERFDLEPERPLFHGLLGDTDGKSLAGLSTRDKAPHVMRIIDAAGLSARMAASLVEVDETLSTWPQLAGDVQLGGATIAAAVRVFGLGDSLPSGRVRVDLARHIAEIREPSAAHAGNEQDGDARESAGSDQPEGALRGVDAILHAVQRAPSGGNTQPWHSHVNHGTLRVRVAPERTSAMDVAYRGSAVAIGAAMYNARVAAAASGLLGPVHFVEPSRTGQFFGEMTFESGTDARLAGEYDAVLQRETNRNLGSGVPLCAATRAELSDAASAEGASLRLIDGPEALTAVAEVLAESDRIRYLTPRLHSQMFAELRWPGRDDLEVGLDIRSMELDDTDVAKLEVSRRADVMTYLQAWDGGRALGDYMRDRIASSSAVVAITFAGATLSDYAHAGMAVERVWLQAQRLGLAVQPISPIFLYALTAEEGEELSPSYGRHVSTLRETFRSIVCVEADELIALVLRLSFANGTTVRSRRLPYDVGKR